ncbi:PIN domain-containing protein [Lysobacter yangpyeongensis]|uniref:PIN domain-containing protein n=1 Tax=Lysobacter yangpyeongensis TaxID=346182 RepID=A0ABW0SQ38_9GAMM
MGLSRGEIARLTSQGRPILCIDTCSVLDIMRDPTRDTMLPRESQAALHLYECMTTHSSLVTLISDQVRFELAANIDAVEKETKAALEKLSARIARVDAIAAEFGATGAALTGHLADHSSRARSVTNRWVAACETAPQSADVANRALSRVNQALAPARKGKESMKDCVVLETYLEAVSRLRAAGLTSRIVLLSSNVKDYTDEGGRLRPELVSEFTALGMEYAQNFGAARHFLGV